jgi:phosphoribosylaminoimidazole-succinocarboxamide synthase
MNKIILTTEFPDVALIRRGKVRDIYDLGEHLLLVATDRLSAFDVVLPDGIPGKGRVLTEISVFWFRQMEDIVQNHIESADVRDFPERLHKYADILEGEACWLENKAVTVECIVRIFIRSGWKEYKETGCLWN